MLRTVSFLTVALALAVGVCAPAMAGPDLSPVKRVEPTYPTDALRARTEGFVEVEFTVAADGTVSDVSVVNAKPARVFERAAVVAVKQWTFAPGGGRGKVRLDFAL